MVRLTDPDSQKCRIDATADAMAFQSVGADYSGAGSAVVMVSASDIKAG